MTISDFEPVMLDDPLGQLPHRELARVADVHRIAPVALEQAVDAVDQVGHIAEGARLRAVAVDREGIAPQRLHDEVRHHAAVVRAHARAVGIEDPDDARVDSVIAMIGHRHRLGEALRLVVDAARPDRVHVAPVALRLRMDLRIAVDLGGGRDQEAGTLRLGQPERLVGAERADLERLDGLLEIVDRAGRATRNGRRRPAGPRRR